jgi:hypothetical protein
MAKTDTNHDKASGAKIDIPPFLPEAYFDGQLDAFGMFIDRLVQSSGSFVSRLRGNERTMVLFWMNISPMMMVN